MAPIDFSPTLNAFIEPIASENTEEPLTLPAPAPSKEVPSMEAAERPYIEALRLPPPPTCCPTDDIASADVFVAFAAGLVIGLAVAIAFSKAMSVCDASV
jgi:hypothetical protein